MISAQALSLSPEVIATLIDANRDAVTTQDADGNLPLSIALDNGASNEVVILLWEAAQAAVSADGRMALHLVAAASRDVAVVRRVFDANRDAATTPDAKGKLPFLLLPQGASEVAAALLFEASKSAPRPVWVALDPATAAIFAVELVAILKATPDAATVAFAAPAGWTPSLRALVRLAPGLGEKNGLRPGEFATVVQVDSDGDRKLTRLRDGEKLNGYFKPADLQHGLSGWLPLHAAAALSSAEIKLFLS